MTFDHPLVLNYKQAHPPRATPSPRVWLCGCCWLALVVCATLVGIAVVAIRLARRDMAEVQVFMHDITHLVRHADAQLNQTLQVLCHLLPSGPACVS